MDPVSAAMAIIPAVIGGATTLIGGQQANAANAKQAMWANVGQANLLGAQMNYNTNQAAVGREFSQSMFNQATAATQGLQKESENFNASQAELTRDWATNLSNTAYQRAYADMKKAGINPILAAGAGGAGTPSVSPASVGSPSASPVSGPTASASLGSSQQARMQDVIGPAVSNAMQASKLASGIEAVGNQADLTDAQREKLEGPDTDLTQNQASSAAELARKTGNEADMVNKIGNAQASNLSSSAALNKANQEQVEARTKLIENVGGTSITDPGVWYTIMNGSGIGPSLDKWNSDAQALGSGVSRGLRNAFFDVMNAASPDYRSYGTPWSW